MHFQENILSGLRERTHNRMLVLNNLIEYDSNKFQSHLQLTLSIPTLNATKEPENLTIWTFRYMTQRQIVYNETVLNLTLHITRMV
jgi:hypothetical protein